MKPFNSHQQRLWRYEIEAIDQYRAGKITFFELAGGTGGPFDAGEIKDSELYGEWLELMWPLEEFLACQKDEILRASIDDKWRAAVEEDISRLKAFLESVRDELKTTYPESWDPEAWYPETWGIECDE